jgi:multiple sugar transport system permease protein
MYGKTWKGRIIYGLIFLILTLGSITMLYPFVLMVSGSIRSEMDETDLDFIPNYLVDADVLYRKFLETKYNQDIAALNRAHQENNFEFASAAVPERMYPGRLKDFRAFLAEYPLPRHWQKLGGIHGIRTVPENLREFRRRLEKRFDGDLEALERETGGLAQSWRSISFQPPRWETPRFQAEENASYDVYYTMQEEAPYAERILVSLQGYFLETMIYPIYGRATPSLYNEAHAGADLESYSDFSLPQTVPPENRPTLRREWLEFVDEELNPSFVILRDVAPHVYTAFLEDLYGDIDALNRAWASTYEAFDDIPLPTGEWLEGAARTDYAAFIETQPPETYLLTGPTYAWQNWLRHRYDYLRDLRQAHEITYARFTDVPMPMPDLEYAFVQKHAAKLRFTYMKRNYINVIDALVLQGQAFKNTLIYCLLVVGLNLLINPMAAYALSRYRLPGTYKFLLILMATMAFPPMVTLIPQFIILQRLNLMNTLVALVLPMIANGYLIFLLKGFFDSLPEDLYEAATIDGASEIRMFFQITMALSKPILAVVALQAFNQAYTAFLYPLLVAPREDMWLISVWLYQYQAAVSMSGVFASVLIASIPTILIFLFAQKIIMRGIAIPIEK